jgi:hypothetical protein
LDEVEQQPRKKRSGSKKRQRTASVALRLTDAEHAELLRRADAVGLSLASFMRVQLIDVPPPRAARRPPIDRTMAAQVLGQLGRIGSNINQIARSFNAGAGGPPAELSGAMAAVLDMRAACLEAMGRKP